MPGSGLGTAGIVAIPIPAGGAVGEVLTKQSGDNYDFDWAAGGGGGPTVDPGTVDNSLLRWVGATPAWEEFTAYILPLVDGVDGQAILTDGAGTLSFGTVSSGGLLSAQYRFSSSIVAADPGAGRFRYDTAVYGTVTQIFIDDFTSQGVDVSNFLALITTGDRLYIQAENDSDEFAVWNVTAPATDNVGWFTIDVDLQAGGNFLTNNDRVLFMLQIGGARTSFDWVEFVAQAVNPGGVPAFTLYQDDGTNFDADTVAMGDLTIPMMLTGNVGLGDPGTEQGGVNVGGVNFDATQKINDFGGAVDAMLVLHRHSTSFGSNLVMSRSNSDTAAHAALTPGQTISQQVHIGWSGTHYDIAAFVNVDVPAGTTVSPTSLAGQISFFTTPDLSNTALLALLIGSDQSIQFSGAYTFPTADGGLGDVLVTDGAGALTFQAAAGLTTLQDAYDNAPAEPQISAAAGDPIGFEPAADPGDIFFLQRADAGQVFLVESLALGYEFTLGPVGNRSWVLSEPSTNANPTTAQIVPDGRTKTVVPATDNGAVIYWDSTFISNIPGGGGVGNDAGFGMVFAVGTLELLEQGNLFSTSIVFNQSTRVDMTAANSGPVYTMVNQPQLKNFGATARIMSQANAVRSQLSIVPEGAGNITLTSHEAFFATIILNSSIGVGDAFCTTVNYFAAKAPIFLGVGGAITTLNVIDIVNIPAAGITNIRGINSQMLNGFFIFHTGTAPSFFQGQIRMSNTVPIRFGADPGNGVELSRPVAGVLRMIGDGGTFDEGLDFDFDVAADTVEISSSTGAGLQLNVDHVSFGTTDTSGTPNWFTIFSAPNLRSPGVGGEYSDVLWTAGGTIDINGLAMGDVQAFKINSPSVILNGGTIANLSNLFVSAMPSFGAPLRQALRVTGRTVVDGHFNQGSQSPGQLTANTNDWQLGQNNNQRGVALLTTDGLGPYNVTGIDSADSFAQDADFITIINISADTITFTNQDVLSLAANRFITATGAGIAVAPNESIRFWYDDTGVARWRHVQEQ